MTLKEKIADLNFYDLIAKLKDILGIISDSLKTLSGRVYNLEKNSGGGAPSLEEVLTVGALSSLPITLSSGDNSAILNVYSSLGGTRIKPSSIDLVNQSGNQVTFKVDGTIQKIDTINNSTFSIPSKASGNYTIATLEDLYAVGALIPTYADNAAAVTGGLEVNKLYKTVSGEVRIRV